ncbi:MAG: glycosyl hydrolase family 18 protein, partial [Candidatus Thermoplasmatota archaeon]
NAPITYNLKDEILNELLIEKLALKESSSSNNIRVNTNATDTQKNPDIAIGSDGIIYAVWEHNPASGYGEIYFSKSMDGGRTWSAGVSVTGITPNAPNRTYPQVAVHGTGTNAYVHVTWMRGDVIGYINSTNGGNTWGANQTIASTGNDPCIAVSTNGDLVVIAYINTSNDYLNAPRSTDRGGSWIDEIVDSSSFAKSYPSVAIYSTGATAIVDIAYNYAYTAGSDERVALKHSSDAGDTYGIVRDIATGDLYYTFSNSLALNATGYPHVTYHHKYSATDRDIYFRKATALDGSSWATAKALRTATTDDREPCIAISGESRIYVGWYDNRRGTYYNVYYNYSADGGSTWLAQDIKVDDDTVATATHNCPAMAFNSQTSAPCFVWHDNRTNDFDIYYWSSVMPGIAPLYQRNAVVAYADKYWDVYNPDYNDYSGSGGDCANFVSQCMIAGGLSLWQGRDGNGADVDSKGAMPFCDYLHLNLVKYQNAVWSYIEYSGEPPSDLAPGDVIIYGDASDQTSPDYWRHAVIVVEGYGNNSKVSAHTSDRYHELWNYAFPGTFNRTNFYRLPNGTITEYTQFRVTASELNVRVGPGTQAPYDTPIGQIKLDQEYIAYEYVINATDKKWWHFWFDNRSAWCSADYTDIVNENIKFKVDTANLRVRTGPATTYPIVGNIFHGQVFTAFELIANETGGEWYHFWYQGRNDTWCCANYTVAIPNATLRTVSGWLPYWAWDSGISTFTSNIKFFDEVSPFWYKANADGSISTYSGAGNQSFVKLAHDNKIKVLPLISNEYNKTLVNTILSNSVIMENHIANITNLVLSNNYDGIDIDYEGLYASDKDNFTSFISKLSEKLHDKNKLLSVCVQAKWSDSITWDGPGAHDYENLSKFADSFRIMAYDEHWSTSEPGPIASYSWVENITKYAVTKATKDKIILGVPFYGRDWNKTTTGEWTSKAYTYKGIIDLIASKGALREWNNSAKVPQFNYSEGSEEYQKHYVYYEDNQSLSFKLDLVVKYGIAGICGFALGYEDPLTWSLTQKKISIGKSFVYYLTSGWNFITLGVNASYTAETLAQSITNCTHVSYWDTSAQKFMVYEKGTGINNFDIQAGIGYLVYVHTKSKISVTSTALSTLTLDLYKGWNSVGWRNFTATNAKSLAQNITSCTAIACWDSGLSRFVIHPVNTEMNNFAVEKWKGYLVYVTTA